MAEVKIHISTNKIGSEQIIGTGIDDSEWMELPESEQSEITNDIVNQNINVWHSAE